MNVITEAKSPVFLTFGLICTGLIALTGVLCVNLSFSEDIFLIVGGRGSCGKGVFGWLPARLALGTRGGGGGDDSSIALPLLRERETERESRDKSHIRKVLPWRRRRARISQSKGHFRWRFINQLRVLIIVPEIIKTTITK